MRATNNLRIKLAFSDMPDVFPGLGKAALRRT
jgi:hypothetical protein